MLLKGTHSSSLINDVVNLTKDIFTETEFDSLDIMLMHSFTSP